MALLEQRGNRFRIIFRLGGRKRHVSVKTTNRKDAEAAQATAEQRRLEADAAHPGAEVVEIAGVELVEQGEDEAVAQGDGDAQGGRAEQDERQRGLHRRGASRRVLCAHASVGRRE